MQYDPQTVQELYRMFNSPAGQQLIAALQKNGGDDLEKAVSNAKLGNYDNAKKTIDSLINDPDIKKLLEQLGR